LRYLKTFSKALNMFFEFIGCQIMSKNFSWMLNMASTFFWNYFSPKN
jgi:hypothetical protein